MRALAKTRPTRAALEAIERDVPTIGREDVLVRVVACGICGSDLAIHEAEGAPFGTSFPQWLGHEYAGVVEAVGSQVASLAPGDRVTAEPSSSCGACAACRAGATNVCAHRTFHGGGFADYVAAAHDRVHPLPDGLPWTIAALCEPLACAAHAVHEVAGVRPGEACAVVGAGPVGLCVALTARAAGAQPVVVARPGRAEARVELARAMGLDAIVARDAAEARALLADRGHGDGADVTFGCAGGDAAVALGLGVTTARGRYVEVALTHAPVNVDLDDVVTRELRVGGAVSHIRSSWTTVLEALEARALSWSALADLVTDVLPLEAWRQGFDLALQRDRGKVLLSPWTEAVEAAP